MTEKEREFGAKLVEANRVVRILLELNVEDEKIRQILVKYFALSYIQAKNILEEEKDFFNS